MEMQGEDDDRSVEKKYRYSHSLLRSPKLKRVALCVAVGCALAAVVGSVSSRSRAARDEEGKKRWEKQIVEQEMAEMASVPLAADGAEEAVPAFHSLSDVQNSQMSPPRKSESKAGAPVSSTAEAQGGGASDEGKADTAAGTVEKRKEGNSNAAVAVPIVKESTPKNSEGRGTVNGGDADDGKAAVEGGGTVDEAIKETTRKEAEGRGTVNGDAADSGKAAAAASAAKEAAEQRKQQLTEKEELKDISLHDRPAAGETTESTTRHVLCCSGDVSSVKPNKKDPAQGYQTAESFKPRWYDRSSGWTGTTYAEAAAFCRAVDGGAQTLCPYEVYCPTGAHHIPFGGHKKEDSSRSPVANHENGWVQVGAKNVCVQYTIFSEDIDPAEEREIEEKAREKDAAIASGGGGMNDRLDSIAQKKKEFYEEAKAAKEGSSAQAEVKAESSKAEFEAEVEAEVEAMKEAAEAELEKAARPPKDSQFATAGGNHPHGKPLPPKDVRPVPQAPDDKDNVPTTNDVTATDLTEKGSSAQTGGPVNTSKFDIATVLHQKFKPLWFNESQGWNGGSHSDAVSFCSSIRGKKLCPYSAMCPHGPGGDVMGGRHALTFDATGDGEQYAPVLGGTNHWVRIGSSEEDGGREDVCKTHRQLKNASPEWGLNDDRKELKRHVMCCTI